MLHARIPERSNTSASHGSLQAASASDEGVHAGELACVACRQAVRR